MSAKIIKTGHSQKFMTAKFSKFVIHESFGVVGIFLQNNEKI